MLQRFHVYTPRDGFFAVIGLERSGKNMREMGAMTFFPVGIDPRAS
jgi:hypothetical protein